MNYNQKIYDYIQSMISELTVVSDQIWDYAELRFEEKQSSALICDVLEREGFTVEKGIASIETAFVGSYGSGSPVIGLLGEFDALSNLSQQPGAIEEMAIQKSGNGHGCGHNLLGVGSLAAAIAIKKFMEENQLAGTIRYYGCPGEEGGSGKTFMARAGVFNELDVALTWHPGTFNCVWAMETLANYQVSFKFRGRSSHAAASPHIGRSALDAVELMNVGVNYLREHVIDGARIHYATVNSGGISPNVVQAEAEVLYLIRAPRVDEVEHIYKRVCKIAEGAALMTETSLEIKFDKACSNYVRNHTLEKVMYEELQDITFPTYSDEEEMFAKAIQSTLSEEDKKSEQEMIKKMIENPSREYMSRLSDQGIIKELLPYSTKKARLFGSTDVGDVSWIVPTVQYFSTCYASGTPFHSWQMVSQGKESVAHKGAIHAGHVLAVTALRLIFEPEIIDHAKKELQDQLDGNEYKCPIPDNVKPSRLAL